MAKITMADGYVIEGTAEELAELAKVFGGEAEESDSLKYGEGDYVRVTRDINEHRKGDVLEIVEVDERPLEYGVRNTRRAPKKSTGRTGWIDEEDFEPFEFIGGEPQEGDKILVMDVDLTFDKYEKGDVLTVERVDEDGDVHVEEFESPVILRDEFEIIAREDGSAEDSVEEVTEDSKAAKTFEVGDLAVVNDKYPGKLGEGDIVKIMSVSGNLTEVFPIKAKRLSDDKDEIYGHDELDPYVPTEKDLNVGDRVMLVIPEGERPRYGFAEVKTGDIGTVIKITGGGEFNAKFDKHPDWHGLSSEVVVVEPSGEKAEERAEAGDIIRITRDQNGAGEGEIVRVREVDAVNARYEHPKNSLGYFASHDAYEIVAKKSDRKDLGSGEDLR